MEYIFQDEDKINKIQLEETPELITNFLKIEDELLLWTILASNPFNILNLGSDRSPVKPKLIGDNIITSVRDIIFVNANKMLNWPSINYKDSLNPLKTMLLETEDRVVISKISSLFYTLSPIIIDKDEKLQHFFHQLIDNSDPAIRMAGFNALINYYIFSTGKYGLENASKKVPIHKLLLDPVKFVRISVLLTLCDLDGKLDEEYVSSVILSTLEKGFEEYDFYYKFWASKLHFR